ncbi:hypothetical protein BCAR13_1360046 [Paraburkholderia caribensis]|nr:hypothetical protein BCAR13_1360046 [Paraburkholderia caribensis]
MCAICVVSDAEIFSAMCAKPLIDWVSTLQLRVGACA